MKQFIIASATILVESGDLGGECPVWFPLSQGLCWTDCVGLRFHHHDWQSSEHDAVADGVGIDGLGPCRGGGYVVANTAGTWLWDRVGRLRPGASVAEGLRLPVSDCCADEQGRRVFMSDAGEEGIPAGPAAEAEPYVRAARWHRTRVAGNDPNELVERGSAAPAEQALSVAFVVGKLTKIFNSSAGQSERLPGMPPGDDLDSGVTGGAVCRMNLGIAGLPQLPAAIELPE